MDTKLKKAMLITVGALFGLVLTFAFRGKQEVLTEKKVVEATQVVEVAKATFMSKNIEEKINIFEKEELASNIVLSVVGADANWVSQAKVLEDTVEKSPYDNMFLVTIDDYLNVRPVMDQMSEVIGRLYEGAGGEILEFHDEWLKIRSNGVEGYILKKFVVIDPYEIEKVVETLGQSEISITCEKLRVWDVPDSEGNVIGDIKAGEVYEQLDNLGDWSLIIYDNRYGYISNEYISETKTLGKAVSGAIISNAEKVEEERLAEIKRKEEEAKAQKEAQYKKGIENSKLNETIKGNPYNLSAEDAYLMACVVGSEAGYEPYEGKLAVANVILNRLNGGYYGNTIKDVIYARNQFSVATNGALNRVMLKGPNAESIKAVEEALSGVNNVPTFASFCSYKVAKYGIYKDYIVIGNHVFYIRK